MGPSLYGSIDGFLSELAEEASRALPEATTVNRGNWDYGVVRGNREAVVSMTMQEDKIGTEVACWENGIFNTRTTRWFRCKASTSEIVSYIEGWLLGATVS